MDRLGRGNSSAERLPARAHLVGVSEGAMSGLAQRLAQQGVAVTGSEPERVPSPVLARLRQVGVRVHQGHTSHACPRTAEFLIHGSGVERHHPERLTAAKHGVAQLSSLDCLSLLMEQGIGLAVAGGRTACAASAMIAWVLTRAGLDPSAVLGSDVPQLGGWARVGAGPHCVVDALDLGDKLGPRSPRLAVLLDVDAGVRDDPRGLRGAALRGFLDTVPSDGAILALGPDETLEKVVSGLDPPVQWLSLENRNSWWGADLREDRGRYRFRAFRQGRFVVEVRLQVPGRRNVLSALAAVAACHWLDVPVTEIKEGLEEFIGLSRDFESRGSYRGVTLVDDAGRDAQSVAEALAIGRQVFGSRRLCVVLGVRGEVPEDPDQFVAACSGADYVLLTEGGPSAKVREEGPALAEVLIAAGARARWLAGLDDVIAELDRYLLPGDVLVTLGAGAVGTIADAFIRRLPRDRHGR